MCHLVDAGGNGKDEDIVLPWFDLYTVGIANTEPSLGHLGYFVPSFADGVLVIKNIALHLQVFSTCSTTANQNQRRVFYQQNPLAGQYYAGIGAYDPGGTGTYNGLYLSANKRLSRNITVNSNYTWSHRISDIYDQQTGSAGVSPFIRKATRKDASNVVETSPERTASMAALASEADRFSRFAARWR